MTALTDAELTAMRATVAGFLPDTCTLQTPTETSDGMGGWTTTYGDTHKNVACRIWQKGGSEETVGAQSAEVTRWVLTVAYDQALDATMRCVHDGHTYQVNDVADTPSERLQRRAWITRIE